MIFISSIDRTRREMTELLNIFLSRPSRAEDCDIIATKVRNLHPSTVLDSDAFMLHEDDLMNDIPDEYKTETHGLFMYGRCKFRGRFIYPVKDPTGLVMGWVGWDKFVNPKYLDSVNYGYKPKQSTVWGMERIKEYYNSDKQVWFTEGIVCALYLRQCGENALALLGSNPSIYVMEIIKRFGSRARVIADADVAGNHLRDRIKRNCKKAVVLQSTIAKDLDDAKEIDKDICKVLKNYNNRFFMSKYFREV